EAQQAPAHHRVLEAVGAVQIPAVRRAARAAARLVVGQPGAIARIVGLLRLPGDDAPLDVDLPAAAAGAVDAVRRAHDLVVLPALAVAVLPGAVLGTRLAVALRERLAHLREIAESIEEMAHDDASQRWIKRCPPRVRRDAPCAPR